MKTNDHEDANGQFEQNFSYTDALASCDRGIFFRYMVHTLAEQYGIELKTEEGFGTGLRAEIERRHTTRRPSMAPTDAAGSPSADSEPESEANGNGGVEHLSGDIPLAQLEPQLEEHWARLAAAITCSW